MRDSEFCFSDLTWCRPETNSRNLRNLTTLGMIRAEGSMKTGKFEIVGDHSLWDVIEGVKTACGQYDRGEKVAFRDEPPLSRDEWLKMRDWHLSQGKRLMSGGSLLIYLLNGLSGMFYTSVVTIPWEIPEQQRPYWVTVNPISHKLDLWKGAGMISPFNADDWWHSAWRRQPSPFWPAIASLKDAILAS